MNYMYLTSFASSLCYIFAKISSVAANFVMGFKRSPSTWETIAVAGPNSPSTGLHPLVTPTGHILAAPNGAGVAPRTLIAPAQDASIPVLMCLSEWNDCRTLCLDWYVNGSLCVCWLIMDALAELIGICQWVSVIRVMCLIELDNCCTWCTNWCVHGS